MRPTLLVLLLLSQTESPPVSEGAASSTPRAGAFASLGLGVDHAR